MKITFVAQAGLMYYRSRNLDHIFMLVPVPVKSNGRREHTGIIIKVNLNI